MKWYCYKTTNTLNGYYYLGKHGSENPETDSYLGSGTAFRRALKKYGREVFVKEILAEFETEDEAYAFERNLISENDLKSNQCYNIVPGGRGGVGLSPKGPLSEEVKRKLREANLGKKLSPETVKKIRETKFARGTNRHSVETIQKLTEINRNKAADPKFRKKLSESRKGKGLGRHLTSEHRKKISEAGKGKKRSEETKQKLREANLGKKLSPETVKKIRETRKKNGPYLHTEEWKKEASERMRKHHSSKEYRASVSAVHLGKVRVHRGTQIREIKLAELSKFLEAGWEKGSGRSYCKGKIWMHDPNTKQKICISLEQEQEYADRGYVRGTGPQVNGNGHLGMKIKKS